MIVPPLVLYSSLSAGAVLLWQSIFYIKNSDTLGINLADGSENSGFTGSEMVLPFPNASLNLG